MTASAHPPVIRPATAHDAAALSELARRTFSDAFAADNTAENLAAFLDATYSTAIQARELADPALRYLVAEQDGALVAFALLRTGTSSPFVADPTAVELQRIYVDRSHHGTGLAQTLMATVFDAATRLGAGALFLGVFERNTKALRFYAAQGFREVGTQTFVVGTDPQQDLVLVRDLTRS